MRAQMMAGLAGLAAGAGRLLGECQPRRSRRVATGGVSESAALQGMRGRAVGGRSQAMACSRRRRRTAMPEASITVKRCGARSSIATASLCALAVSTDDMAVTWPGSRGIAIAKASTANAFSSDTAPMSTARLYTLSQPGHSLWGAANGNPLNPLCAGAADDDRTGIGKVCGGTITFGGGLALVQRTDARRRARRQRRHLMRRSRDRQAGATGCGAGAERLPSDDIVYTTVDGPSVFAPSVVPEHIPRRPKIGEEPPGDRLLIGWSAEPCGVASTQAEELSNWRIEP